MQGEERPTIKTYAVKPKSRPFYQVRIFADGVLVKTATTKATNRREAEKARKKIQEEQEEPGPDIEAAFDSFMVFKRGSVSPQSAAIYSTCANEFIAEADISMCSDITSERVARYVQDRLAKGDSPNNLAKKLRHIKTFVRYLFHRHMLKRLPIIEMPKGKTVAKGRPLTDQEFDDLLEVCSEVFGAFADEWRFCLKLICFTGLRLSEAYELTYDSPDSISIIDLDKPVPKLWIPQGVDKSRKESVTALAPDACEILQERLAQGHLVRGEHVLPFPNPSPRECDPDRLALRSVGEKISLLGRLCKIVVGKKHKTGADTFASAHDLRRTFGTRWALRNVPVAVLKKMMRHSSISTTLKYYAHIDANSMRRAMDESL